MIQFLNAPLGEGWLELLSLLRFLHFVGLMMLLVVCQQRYPRARLAPLALGGCACYIAAQIVLVAIDPANGSSYVTGGILFVNGGYALGLTSLAVLLGRGEHLGFENRAAA